MDRIFGLNLRKLIGIVLLLAIIIVTAVFAWRCYLKAFPLEFYLSLIIFCAGFVGLTVYLCKPGFILSASITALIFAIILPGFDFIYSYLKDGGLNKPVKITYSYKEAKANPIRFIEWWNYYVNEWTKGPKKIIEQPDKKGILPFVFKPNSEVRFFDSTIRINNLGFRGKEISVNKGNAFRIVALGESTTFGATMRPSDRPWPEVLQELVNNLSCNVSRRIEIINAGTEAYDLKDNLERVRRDILSLNPDLIISYHGFNGLRYIRRDLLPVRMIIAPKRGSKILTQVESRVRKLMAQKSIRQPMPLSEVLKSQYAEFYCQLIQMGRAHKFAVALAPFNMAVTRESPDDAIDFYAAGFPYVRQFIPAIEDHNALVEAIARMEEALFIETRPGIAGAYDDDIFIDLVHFTQKGRDMLAKAIFRGLKPFLISTLGIESDYRSPSDLRENDKKSLR